MARKTRAKTVKIGAYKRILSQIKQYEKLSAKGKLPASDQKDDVAEQIKGYLTKKGTLSKTKTRSNKQKKAFNAALEEWKKLHQPILTRQRKERTFGKKEKPFSKATYKHTLDNLEDIRKGFSGIEETETEEDKSTISQGIEEMKDFFNDDLVSIFYRVTLLTEEQDEMSNKDALMLVFKTFSKRMNDLPDILKQYANADDRFTLIERCMEILQEENLTEEELFDLLKDANLKASEGQYVNINNLGD